MKTVSLVLVKSKHISYPCASTCSALVHMYFISQNYKTPAGIGISDCCLESKYFILIFLGNVLHLQAKNENNVSSATEVQVL